MTIATTTWRTLLSTTFSITYCPSTIATKPSNVDRDHDNAIQDFVEAAIERYGSILFESLLPDFPENYSPPNNTTTTTITLEPLDTLELHIVNNNGSSSSMELNENTNEEYSITIGKTGNASLKAKTVFGIVRGLETFCQLVSYGWYEDNKHEQHHQHTFLLRHTPVAIHDYPEYSYRGLLIDTSRHYLPVSLILKNLDAMAMNKLNVLHWHIIDSNSFPFQSKTFPELSEKGAFANGKRVYTTHDIQNVVQQAYVRGIRVIPEFDMPGHTAAIIKSHPEFMSHCPNAQEPLNPTISQVYDFIQKLYMEIATLFIDKFVHIGGDEVPLGCWKKDPSIVKFMQEHNIANETKLFDFFETKLLSIVHSPGIDKTSVVWQEVFNLGLTLTNDTIIDVWKGQQGCLFDESTARQATQQSMRVIISGCWYLDNLSDTWQQYYRCIPRNIKGITDEQKERIIGGHASMWGEHVDSTNFMSRVWPRASAAGERLWKGTGAESTVQERLQAFRCRMIGRGILAGPVGPGTDCYRSPPPNEEALWYTHEMIDT
eukprot:CAMPEP_0195296564 /NCGR_PEP_ID=MMETSP0707-20130614/19716_1 /TAXON_ID=33640 /ORGANISM="Asterionellopsis glacialis, Strain CCMP134" /LENGTH=543 /DNA_ID=CAMNT_0040358111 /DNA_START=378 /DNA_END=2009 /DNA_ORIENTATION=+